jgi:hypothetical protein
MKPGNLDLLTVLPVEDVLTVDSKGPLYVMCRIESTVGTRTMNLPDGKKILISEWFQSPEGTEKMLMFWKYMDTQWFKKKGMISLWNLSDLISSSTGLHRLISRTNCAMERYNRTYNELFPRRHPNLCAFAAGTYLEAGRRVTWLRDVAAARAQPPTYDDIPFPAIPEDYADFEVPSVENYGLTERSHVPARSFYTDVPAAAAVAKKSERSDTEPTGVSPVKKSARTVDDNDAVEPAAPTRQSKRIADKKKEWEV